MEFDKVIQNRRSIREFSSQMIDKNNIIKLIECARLAPSAGNRQPWHFVILEDKIKNEVANIMESEIKTADIILDKSNYATRQYNPTSSLKASIKIIKEAPILILVFRKKNDNWLEGDYLSIGCAVEHICLKATELELGSLWIRDIVYTRDKISNLMGYDDMELVTGVVIGYSIEYPYKRVKKNIEEIMEWRNDK